MSVFAIQKQTSDHSSSSPLLNFRHMTTRIFCCKTLKQTTDYTSSSALLFFRPLPPICFFFTVKGPQSWQLTRLHCAFVWVQKVTASRKNKKTAIELNFDGLPIFTYLFTKKVRLTSHKSELCSHYKSQDLGIVEVRVAIRLHINEAIKL